MATRNNTVVVNVTPDATTLIATLEAIAKAAGDLAANLREINRRPDDAV